MLRKAFFTIVWVFVLLPSKGQQPIIDSLKKVAATSSNDTLKASIYQNIGHNFFPSPIDSCFYYWEKSLAICNNPKASHNKKIARTLRNIRAVVLNGMSVGYNVKGDIVKSLEKGFEVLKDREEMNDLHGMAECLNNISFIYTEQGDTSSSLSYLKKSKYYYAKIKDWGGVAFACKNISKIFIENKQYDIALNYLKQAAAHLEKLPNLTDALGGVYNSIGDIYRIKGDLKKAKELHFRALKIMKGALTTRGKSQAFQSLSKYYELIGKNDSAFYYARQSYEVAKQTQFLELIKDMALALSIQYKKKGEYKRSLELYEEYTLLKDSVNNTKNQKLALKNKIKHEYETKAAADSIKHEQENKLKEVRFESEKTKRYYLYGGLALVVVFLLFLYSRFRIIRSQKFTIEHQKLIVEQKNKEVTDSIVYAKRIQAALLPSFDLLSNQFSDSFILFKPKDIVSGDFYWAAQKNNMFYLAVCDCTGHGVPGAFMSLLNISFLNEAVVEKGILQPNDILNHVRKRLIENISQDGGKDGMDATLLCFDFTKNVLTYAAAYNNPILVQNGHLLELQADKMPVGKGEKDDSFTLYSTSFQKGDALYLYTDGYPDQFGGPKGKKFKTGNLNKLLLETGQGGMANQFTSLETHFKSWKGDFEQLDDVCVIGIKI